jgi:hypothetical protein
MLTSRPARLTIAAVGGVLALLVLSQLLLPSFAEQRLRDRLERHGKVDYLDVRAFPALELLDGRADRVSLRMHDARSGAGRFADLIADTRDTDRLDAVVDGLRIFTVRFRRMTLHKRGRDLDWTAVMTAAELRAALPAGFEVRPVASGDGALVFEGTVTLLGRRFTGQAVVAARNGKLLLAPNFPFGGFLSLTIFEDPRIEVLDIGARSHPDGFVLTARARLRE